MEGAHAPDDRVMQQDAEKDAPARGAPVEANGEEAFAPAPQTEVERVFATLRGRADVATYNGPGFKTSHALTDVRRAIRGQGLKPGDYACDFRLPKTDGGRLRLLNLRGMPIVLFFGSPTCPGAVGSVPAMKKLYDVWCDRVWFVEIVVRQAHPGSGAPPYATFEEKLEDARRYRDEEGLPWPVAVDDLGGTVHQVYGRHPRGAYLLDVSGRIAYGAVWAHAPALHRALEQLFDQGCHGIVGDGFDRSLHAGPAITAGWRAIERGMPESEADLRRALPGAAPTMRTGYRLRPLLAPLTLRATPLPKPVRRAFLLAAAAPPAWLLARRVTS